MAHPVECTHCHGQDFGFEKKKKKSLGLRPKPSRQCTTSSDSVVVSLLCPYLKKKKKLVVEGEFL